MSGLLLNLVLDYQNKYYPSKKIGVFHQDFEAQYTVTTGDILPGLLNESKIK